MSPEPSLDSPARACRKCERTLPPDAPGGNCPACLWAVAAADEGQVRELEAPRRFGSYELLEEIARGGMGVVWKARQDGLNRDVALKMILTGSLATSEQVIRFYTEARAAARLDHPGIVPIYEIGEDEGSHFYTMRLMECGSLAAALKAAPQGAPEDAARVVLAVARAIHFAHQRGVLHRDVKPSNILLDGEGKPHIADFGLARLAESSSSASRSGAVLGTPAYMAPEQASGSSSEVTTAADVYSLGAVLFELLTGAPPFEAETPLQTLRLLCEKEPTSPRSRNPKVPRDLDVVCLKCLQKEPEKRYASAAELADDLERWLAGKPILARPVSALARLASWARRKPELAAAIAALIFVLALGFAITLALYLEARREGEARAAALRLEEGQRLAFQSLAVVEDNPGQALLLALEAAERTSSASASNALLVAMEACRERRRFLGHEGSLNFVSFRPDGRRIVTAAMDRTARIWDLETGAAVHVLRGHGGAVRTAAFSPDGTRVVTASDDKTARIWDAERGEEVMVLAGHTHPLISASFSPSGERVLTAGGIAARLLDARTGELIHALDRHTAEIHCARFSADGTRVATGAADGSAMVWDSASGSVLATLSGHSTQIIDLCFSASGNRIALASDPDASVWDASTFEKVCELRGQVNGIYSVALNADGTRAATGSEDFTACIWDARSGAAIRSLPHGHKVWTVAMSPDDRLLLTASFDTVARVWDLATGRLVSEMRGHASPLYHAAFSPNGKEVATACVDFTARLWTVQPKQPLFLDPGDDLVLRTVDVAADGKAVVEICSGRSMGRVLEIATRREIARLEGHEAEIVVARFDPDGRRIVTGSEDKTGGVWDASTGLRLLTLAGHEGAIYFVCFSPDGRLVLTTSLDSTLRVWESERGAQVAIFRSEGPFRPPAFSPASDRVAFTDERGSMLIAELPSGEVRRYSKEAFGHFTSVDFGPEGRRVVTTTRTTRAYVRALPGCELVATLVHPSRAACAMYSGDKRWIATLANDGVVRIWDGGTYEERLAFKRAGSLADIPHFPQGSRNVVISWISWIPAGFRMGLSRKFVVYPLDVLGEALSAKFGDLTPDERDHFQVGSPDERRQHRAAWRGGHIYGETQLEKR